MRQWFRDIRIKKGFTQSHIAELSGVDVTTINKIELGTRNPHPDTAKRIADVLGFEWTRFYESDSPTKEVG